MSSGGRSILYVVSCLTLEVIVRCVTVHLGWYRQPIATAAQSAIFRYIPAAATTQCRQLTLIRSDHGPPKQELSEKR
jgi:hypothetical protein